MELCLSCTNPSIYNQGRTDKEAALVQAVAWCWTGNMPLLWPIADINCNWVRFVNNSAIMILCGNKLLSLCLTKHPLRIDYPFKCTCISLTLLVLVLGTMSISWLLMPGLLASPSYLQLWYWHCGTWIFLSSLRENLLNLRHLYFVKWEKKIQLYIFIFSSKPSIT